VDKVKRGYRFNPTHEENVQLQIEATISLIEAHIIPAIPEQEGLLLTGYLQRLLLATAKPKAVIPVAWDAPVGEMGEPLED
jgi:hypothetical protein